MFIREPTNITNTIKGAKTGAIPNFPNATDIMSKKSHGSSKNKNNISSRVIPRDINILTFYESNKLEE
jgi:hypothetical protein